MTIKTAHLSILRALGTSSQTARDNWNFFKRHHSESNTKQSDDKRLYYDIT